MDSIFEALKNMGAARLAVMLLTFFSMIIFFIFIAFRSNTPGMTLLYNGLSAADTTEISAKLEASRIPYKLGEDGTSVTVPQKDVGKARIMLAQEGLPRQGSVGYEIFDQKQSFGTTSFVQSINQVRALEGELSRTISTIDNVRSARVHLVLPQRELFARDAAPASASVFLNLRNSAALGREQVRAIQHLVAASVPRLKASNVAIIDQSGDMLASGEEPGADTLAARNSDELKQRYETRLTRSIEEMVGRVVGFGKVRATVTADMNFDVINRNSESYNPEGQVVRSIQSSVEESIDNSGNNTATVTVENNLPGLPASAVDTGTNASSRNNRSEEVTNYEISRTIENTVRAGGQVERLSIAVLLDGRYATDDSVAPPANAPKDWQAPQKYIPRSQTELDQITNLVKSAVGFDASRGDTVEVVSMQFVDEPFMGGIGLDDSSTLFGFQKSDLIGIAETITLSIVAILVIMLVLKPLAAHLATAAATRPQGSGSSLAEETAMLTSSHAQQAQLAPPTAANEGPSELEAMIDMSQVEGKVKASSIQKINELVTNHPSETVAVIRSWMSQES